MPWPGFRSEVFPSRSFTHEDSPARESAHVLKSSRRVEEILSIDLLSLLAMAQWDKIAAIFALCSVVFYILPSIPLFKVLCSSLLRRLPLRANQCTQLLWEDIPEGILHDCSCPTPYVCEHKIQHTGGKVRCWEDLFSIAFSKGWANNDRIARRVPKPEALPLTEHFMHIDFTVLMAFIISTVGCNEDLGSLMWGLSTYTRSDKFVLDAGGAQRLHLKARDQCLVTHLFAESCRPWTPDGDKNIRSWSKIEIVNLLKGYPPFYSATIRLHNKTRVNFPITSVDGIRKGGWVLAVKLGKVTRPLPFYFESQHTTSDALRKPTFQLATEWVRDMVAQPFTLTFPENVNVIAALNALNRLCQGQEYIGCALEKSGLNEQAADSLTEEDAIKAMDIFNRPTHMLESERMTLEADAHHILVPLLSAAVFGVKEVLQFEKRCINLKERLPEDLVPSSQIYVRDCARIGFDASRRYPPIDIRQRKGSGSGW